MFIPAYPLRRTQLLLYPFPFSKMLSPCCRILNFCSSFKKEGVLTLFPSADLSLIQSLSPQAKAGAFEPRPSFVMQIPAVFFS